MIWICNKNAFLHKNLASEQFDTALDCEIVDAVIENTTAYDEALCYLFLLNIIQQSN